MISKAKYQNRSKNPNLRSIFFQAPNHLLKSIQGNVLVYLVVLILIFGVLGVTIISLFTTATSSSATPNNARRAAYVTESAMRYAFSELRNSGFATAVVNTLDATDYSLDSGGEFSFNVFGAWFEANETKVITSETAIKTIALKIPAGTPAAAWVGNSPAGLWMVNFNYLDLTLERARDGISSWTQSDDDPTILTITIGTNGDFVANQGEPVCLAVKLTTDQTIAEADTDNHLYVKKVAKDFFPAYDGVININRIDYVYERLVYEPGNNRVKLEKITAAGMPNAESDSAFPLDLKEGNDFIVLSPRNYFIIPRGTADTVSVAGTLDRAVNIYDTAPLASDSDIDLMQYDLTGDLGSINRSGRDYVTVNNENKTIDIGNNLTSQTDFGGVWFKGDTTVGGKEKVCNAGACDFGRGVRVFFTLDYEGTSDGLTFALISAAHNTTSSIGGDINASELLGYAGDSRTVVDPNEPTATTNFLDGTGYGLRPPKIALEFDTYNNIPYQTYCIDDDTIRDDNRNDPFSSDIHQDALQFVFWGLISLPMPCRDYTIAGSPTVTNHPTYDDNRHDVRDQPKKWEYETGGPVRSTPAVHPDDGTPYAGTVYVGSEDKNIYAFYPADRLAEEDFPGPHEWKFDTKGVVNSSPIVGPDGRVYVGAAEGSDKGLVYGFNPADRLNEPDGGKLVASREWVFKAPDHIYSSPAIGADGTVYIGDEQGNFFALDPASRLADPEGDENSLDLDNEWWFTDDDFNRTSLGRPAIGPALDIDPSGTLQRIYITGSHADDQTLYALDPADGSIEWTYDKNEPSRYMPAADPVTGVVYTEKSLGRIIARSFDGITVDTEWNEFIGTDHFTPVVKNGVVYAAGIAGSSAGKLNALDSSDGTNIPNFTAPADLDQVQTTPAIAPDGTIYFASKDGLLYAIEPSGSEKWTFAIPINDNDSLGYSSPVVGSDGTVYIGSSGDDKLYAVNDFAVPRNIKDNYVTAVDDTVGGEPVSLASNIDWLNGNDLAGAGPWAVRLEVIRSPEAMDPDAIPSKYVYILRAWIRQCTTETCGNIFGTIYEDTRIRYSETPHLAQTIILTQAQHDDFDTFIFGFTGATDQDDTQRALISNFKLSFIRFNDPVVP